MSSSFSGNPNNFLPENYIFPEDNDEEYDVKLRQYLNTMSTAVNSKDSGLYTNEEVITGQKFIPTFGTTTSSSLNYRDVYRKVIDFGVLPNTGTKSVAHGITTTQNYSFVKIYGAATALAASAIQQAIPLPFMNVLVPADGVELVVDATNIIMITTSASFAIYTRSFVVVEYIKLV